MKLGEVFRIEVLILRPTFLRITQRLFYKFANIKTTQPMIQTIKKKSSIVMHWLSDLCFKVPINPKLLFRLNKYMCNSEQNGANIFDFGQNRNFL